ncbi:hypothetical protein [Salana multivorans]
MPSARELHSIPRSLEVHSQGPMVLVCPYSSALSPPSGATGASEAHSALTPASESTTARTGVSQESVPGGVQSACSTPHTTCWSSIWHCRFPLGDSN